jgi:transmembrane sensor
MRNLIKMGSRVGVAGFLSDAMKTARIKDEAARRVIELEKAKGSDAYRADLERWFDEDPQNRAVFDSMQQAWKAVDDLKILHIGSGERSEDTAPQTRNYHLLSICAAAVLIFGIACTYLLLGPAKRMAPPPVAYWDAYSTDYGELKTVQLMDGSLMQMNTNTQVRVNRAATGREMILEKGEAWFDVRHNSSQPFLVHVGLASVNAIGTTFSVWRKTDATAVTLVKEGRVKVTQPSYDSKVLTDDQTAVAGPDGVEVADVDPKVMERMLSWKKGELAFEGQTLKEVVAAFNRFNREKLKIDDPSIAQRRIGGTYSARDPKGFAQLLERTFGIHYFVESPRDAQGQVIHLSLATP